MDVIDKVNIHNKLTRTLFYGLGNLSGGKKVRCTSRDTQVNHDSNKKKSRVASWTRNEGDYCWLHEGIVDEEMLGVAGSRRRILGTKLGRT